jgi:hypothetical protein
MAGATPATLTGFVIGRGPHYLTGTLDDFDGGGVVPPGSLISIESALDGGFTLPAANQLTYPPNAYQVTHAVSLNLAITPKPTPIDTVVCP